ncbi:MAG: hypothetical protein AB7P17_07555 [Nitrospirales bacterium]
MKLTSHALVLIGIFSMGIGIAGCSDSSNNPGNNEPKGQHTGFTASMSGAVNAEVVEKGLVTYLPPKDQGSMIGTRPGYFLVANNLLTDPIEGRAIMITFRIPDGAQPGNYHLMAPDPRKIGENFDVQVETVEKGDPNAFHTNTEGTITLEKFSPDRTYPDISNIKGRFQFVTEDGEGRQVSVNGAFDFPAGEVLTKKGEHPLKKPSRA